MPRLATFNSAALISLAVFLLPRAASADSIACATGDFQALDVATVETTQTTDIKGFRNLPAAQLTLGSQGCMRVQFSAQVKANAGALRVRVTVDGSPIAAPNFVEFHTAGADYDSRSATFVIPGLPAGNHVVRIQYASPDGKPVAVSNALMVVWTDPLT